MGFCCAAKVSGFLFPSYVNSTCISMAFCNPDGSFTAVAPGLWQVRDQCDTQLYRSHARSREPPASKSFCQTGERPWMHCAM